MLEYNKNMCHYQKNQIATKIYNAYIEINKNTTKDLKQL